MDLFGEFQKGEIDGKQVLVYHNVMKPLPQTQIPNSSDEETTIQKPLSIQNEETSSDKVAIDSGDVPPLSPLFVCPGSRVHSTASIENITLRDEYGYMITDLFFNIKTSPLFGGTVSHKHVLPLFWCNNKEADPDNDCYNCRAQKVGTYYYYCVRCDKRYHKECVESPLEISYPSHVKHSLQLFFSRRISDHCILCRNKADLIIYYCALCDIYMHPICAQAAIPFFIDEPKRHNHTLTLFPRQASLKCNVCGLVNKLHLTYVCRSICDFVAHSDCIQIPHTIRISRHLHRVSFTSSLSLGKWFCGVCGQEVDLDYGAYTCNVCSGYAVHTRCALRKDIWDGIELEGVPDEDGDVEPPFQRISDGIILHFSHDHNMKFETNGVYNGNKFCQACGLPVYEENLYVCVECDFILHERCADAPRKKIHPLHPHPLKQEVAHVDNFFVCLACYRASSCFGYKCANQDCYYTLDVVCASVSEPFNYQDHQHPLFLALDPKEKPICHICKSADVPKVFNCIEFQCDFIICFKCATVPHMVRYKHDEHYLTFCLGDEASGSDRCDLCEGKLAIGSEGGFYKCNDCCTTLHINCLLGPDPYLKTGQTILLSDGEILVRRNNSSSRPICSRCNIRCPYPTFVVYTKEMISFICCAIGIHFVRIKP